MTDKDKAVNEKGDLLVKLIGAAPTDSVADVIAAAKAKIDSFAQFGFANLPDDQRTYPKVVEGLVSTVKTASDTVAQTKATMAADKAKYEGDVAKAVANAAEISKSLADAQQQLADQTKKYNDNIAELTKSKDQFANDKNELNKSLDALKAENQRKITALGLQIAALTKENAAMKIVIDSHNQTNPQTSGGTVLWVNQRDNVAFISLGSEDNLQRKTTFNVYPQGTANVTNTVPKGKVEVTNITGLHTSEARIVENAISDPLLPGDVVHSADWLPNQHSHYAIGGLVDMDGSGTDQTRKLIELIQSSGGVVDAYVENYKDSDGKPAARPKGAITINTRYLIIGDQKAETPEGLARSRATTTLITEADRKHVEQIGLNKFLSMSGYVAPVGVGPGAAGAEIQGTIQGAPNNAFQNSFRPRQPGAAPANSGTTP
jgi:hypothetical protein